MRFYALLDIPNGIPAGREFDCTEDEGNVLVLVGAARKVEEPKKQPEKKSAAKKRDEGYNRRDMVAASHAAHTTESED
jgi:hypothetical protein